jgi:hypothetical protein
MLLWSCSKRNPRKNITKGWFLAEVSTPIATPTSTHASILNQTINSKKEEEINSKEEEDWWSFN